MSASDPRARTVSRLLLTVLLLVLTGCAGVPSSSAPQAIGTVERPAPQSLPKPTPGMEPDLLLREFLKATADPANRHLAARQFLTDSASDAWDDQGSALLIDKVVFVETRSSDKVSVTMKADILGSLSDLGVFETAEGRLPDPGPIELVQTSGGWRINRLPNGVFLDWQQFQADGQPGGDGKPGQPARRAVAACGQPIDRGQHGHDLPAMMVLATIHRTRVLLGKVNECVFGAFGILKEIGNEPSRALFRS